MVILGIDPGIKGGICFLYPDDIAVHPMPPTDSDWSWFRSVCMAYKPQAFVEKVHSLPKQGVASTFKFGTGYGFIRGMLIGLSVPTYLVTPQAWMKTMLAGESKADKKAASIAVAARMWPDCSFLPSERCRKPSDGMCEAALIAGYGRLRLGIEKIPPSTGDSS